MEGRREGVSLVVSLSFFESSFCLVGQPKKRRSYRNRRNDVTVTRNSPDACSSARRPVPGPRRRLSSQIPSHGPRPAQSRPYQG